MSWVPLHVHSQHSILDATASLKALAAKAAEYQIPALALTDHGNMYGAIEFYKACKEVKVKPIIGCEVYVAPASRRDKSRAANGKVAYHLTLLAKNLTGYHNLSKLSSKAFLEGFYYHPRIDYELLKEHAEGIICLSGCMSSHISQSILQNNLEDGLQALEWHRALFGDDFYLELQRHQMSEEALVADGMAQESWLLDQHRTLVENQRRLNEVLLEWSQRLHIPCVATNDIHYIDRADWQAHEILLNIQSGEPCEIWEKDSQGNNKCRVPNPKRRTYSSHELYFKSPAQMRALFADCPAAIDNTLQLADKCDLTLDFNTKHYPVYLPPGVAQKAPTEQEHAALVANHLKKLCEEAIATRYSESRLSKVAAQYPGENPLAVVQRRLAWELEVIISKGLVDYLLIVYDFIHWAKSKNIPVGPGRGSGAGSIVLYLLGVTDIEPLRFNLFFERFLNPERLSYPDIDVDICMDRRHEVIEYTVQRYGRDNVAQIITFGTMKAKMVVRDVGRVCSIALPKVNAIAKLIPEDPKITLEKAVETDPDLARFYESDAEVRQIIDIGKKLEGSLRNTGIHAAGIIVSDQPLLECIPVCVSKESELAVTQYSMKPLELVGMLKIDFLGLKTLTALQATVKMIHEGGKSAVSWTDLPLDDKPTFDLLNQGKTIGIFQLESGGMQDVVRQLQIDKFEEIIAVGALYRPGPMDMIPSFISRKHGREVIEYDHPLLESILSETYGIMVYQEQVMQIAQKLAKYSLGEGDVLRYAMGKKVKAAMEEQREKFRKGALENGISENVATTIFEKIEKFASYGFNKSHAAAYAYLTYATAYFKANYSKEWMASLMTCECADLSTVAKFIREAQAMGIAILSPDVNESGVTFKAVEQGIRFAMTAIRGVGEGIVQLIVQERQARGPFKSLTDFLKRLDLKRIGRKVVEALVAAGCFDFTGWRRDQLLANLETTWDACVRDHEEQALGVMTLFSLMPTQAVAGDTPPPPSAAALSPVARRELLIKEKELLGFFLTGHPLDEYRDWMQKLSCVPLSKLHSLDDGAVVRTAFLIDSLEMRFSNRTQKKFAIMIIGDGTDHCELPIWSDLVEEKGALLRENQLIYAVLQVDKKVDPMRLNCKWLDDLTLVNEEMIRACDQALDRAKFQATKFTRRPVQPQAAKQAGSTSPTAPKVLRLVMDADAAALSHLLALKELFRKHRGSVPVSVAFESAGKKIGELLIAKEWGVEPSAALLTALQRVKTVKVVT